MNRRRRRLAPIPLDRHGTASSLILRAMLRYASSCGVDLEPALAALELTRSEMAFERRISDVTVFRAWTEIPALAADPYFGLHVAEHGGCDEYDALGYAFHFSETLGAGLDRLGRFYRVLGDSLASELTVDGSLASLRHLRRLPRHQAEAHLASVVLAARAHTGAVIHVEEVRFAHATPAQTTHHAKLFRAPVKFGCAASELVFPAKLLALPHKTANAGVGRVLDRYLTELLLRLPRGDGFVERARAAVAEQVRRNGRPSLVETAAQLRASVRTVQRRLREHGISHARLVDDVRREVAERMAADPRTRITEIALELGFADVSGFRRAHERWTGIAPSRARRG